MRLLDSFRNPPPIDLVPLMGVLKLCAVALGLRLSRKSVAWTCAITTLVYGGVASDGVFLGLGFEPLFWAYCILWGFICAGVPVLLAAAVGHLAQSTGKLSRAGLMSVAGAVAIPVTWARYISVFGI